MDAAVHAPAAAPATPAGASVVVRHFRQLLVWPLRLMPLERAAGDRRTPWTLLQALPGSPWQEVVDAYTGDATRFHERHYHEFLSFLPYVQRFLYGEGRSARAAGDSADSPMRVLRRGDVARLRVLLRPGDAPLELALVHVDLHFFSDVEVVLLCVELAGDALPLAQAQELLYRLGRAYPAGWDDAGRPQHGVERVEWLAADGRVLSASAAEPCDPYLAFVARHRAPRIAPHWAWLLEPLVSDVSEREGALRYRQVEYHRMPVMGYLAVDDPAALSRADFVRLGLVTGAADEGSAGLPYADEHLADFERRYCDDRYWAAGGPAPHTRYLCNGHALVVVGDARAPFFGCGERGVLAQFRHQHFLLFLIAHFQKAALLTFSDCLVEALRRLDVQDADSVRRFKRTLRGSFEAFLRFTHCYWFHEVSEQPQLKALYQLCARHLGLDPLYAEVKERIDDMNSYLDADSLRRQANTVVRLTVVTIFGLIGTVTTGFLGMNLLASADEPLALRMLYFGVTFVATIALTVYTIVKSKRLSDWLDALSDERLSAPVKLKVLADVWRSPRD